MVYLFKLNFQIEFFGILYSWKSGPPLILNLILLALSVTSFVFYLRYVGKMTLTLYVIFNVVLVCLLPIAALGILYKIKSLERIIEVLQKENPCGGSGIIY